MTYKPIKTTIKSALNALVCLLLVMSATLSHAERIKDLASIQGVRQNQLIGYGLVVGLDGSGDQTTQTPFTVQTMLSMLQQLGINVPHGTSLQLKNVAAVMVTASLPAFAQPGQTLDVTVSSMGNAKSLRGGTLLMTALKGADGKVYAMSQGNVLVSGAGASAGGSQTQVNHLSVGRIANGATVERTVPSMLGNGNQIYLELRKTDFTNARLVTEAINKRFGGGTAAAQDGRVIRVHAPATSNQRVAFLGEMENIEVMPSLASAKVILNARTGSIVLNQGVMVEPCAVAHGNLSVTIDTTTSVSQPEALSGGQTVVVQNSEIDLKQGAGKILMLKKAASLSDVVKALNAIGATPQDLLAILQAMKVSGALRAELEII